MLAGLAIRDIVLIDHLELDLKDGLCVLTGETGAGKSILLDALNLAIGAPAESALVAPAAERGSVTAVFQLPKNHVAYRLLEEQGIRAEGEIILRRVQGRDGRTRAFVNDEAVSVGFLRQLGDLLVEIHGQHDDRGLLSAAQHRGLLDAFAGNTALLRETGDLYRCWRAAQEKLALLQASVSAGQAEIEFLTHAVDELTKLDPRPSEEAELAAERSLMMNAERIGEALAQAEKIFETDMGAIEDRLSGALSAVERVAPQAGPRLEPVLGAFARALNELSEARSAVEGALADLEFDPGRLEFVEERLFALRAQARKHNVAVEALASLKEELSLRLSQIHDGDGALETERKKVAQARKAYLDMAASLSQARIAAAAKLDQKVMAELKPLKLEKARFHSELTVEGEEKAGAEGYDRVSFLVSTNPGAPLAPMIKIASGGELARFILALKVALASRGSAPTLVFDEVDSGVGGAVADAVGERLAKLSEDVQVIVVTHSPQVAARGTHHWCIQKAPKSAKRDDVYLTRVTALGMKERREEIARMLAGAKVTDEARAAASRLIERT